MTVGGTSSITPFDSSNMIISLLSSASSSSDELLSTLNSPPLISCIGLVAISLLPTLQSFYITKDAIHLSTIKVLNILFYILNLVSTSQKGRLDGIQQQQLVNNTTNLIQDNNDDKSSKIINQLTIDRNRSLFNPSGWAFIIWAPIFIGELIFTLSSSIMITNNNNDNGINNVKSQAMTMTNSITSIFRQTSAGFIIGQLFQSLWSASFRPKYFVNKKKPLVIFISASMLAGIAISLSYAHSSYALIHNIYNIKQYCLYFLPISLHYGWTTAATLVNINGNIATLYSTNKKMIAWTGHISAAIATAIGVIITLTKRSPIYGGVISWALMACSTGMNNRIKEINIDNNNKDNIKKKTWYKDESIMAFKDLQNEPGYYGAIKQKWLCRVGSIISGCTSLVIAFMIHRS